MPRRAQDFDKFDLIEVDPGSISRTSKGPRFDFIEEAINQGSSYRFGNGYILVGGRNSLMPEFILECYLPTIIPSVEYSGLIRRLQSISCGMVWFDSSDFTTFDLIWRMGLSARPCAVLFEAPTIHLPSRVEGDIDVRPIELSDLPQIVELFTSMPAELGGQPKETINRFAAAGGIYGGYRDDHLIGSALVIDQHDLYTSVGAVAVPGSLRFRGIGFRFMQALLAHLTNRRRVVVGGVGVENIFAYRALSKLGMIPTKQGWIAKLELQK